MIDVGFLYLSNTCNMQCRHCYVSSIVGNQKGMNKNVLKKSLLLFSQLEINNIRLAGGEPTLHPNFHEIVKTIKQKQFSLGMISNGIKILNSTRLRHFVTENFGRLWLSLYGITENGHDYIRNGHGFSFPEFIDKFLIFQDHYTKYNPTGILGISFTVSPDEVNSIPNSLVSLANLGIKRVRIVPLQLDGRAKDNFSFAGSEFINAYHRTIKNLPGNLSARFSELRFNDPSDVFGTYEKAEDSCLLANRKMTTIMEDGSIYPCCFLANKIAYCIGKVGHTTPEDITSTCNSMPKKCISLKGAFWADNKNEYVCPISYVKYK